MWILLIPLILAEIVFWLFLAYVAWGAFKAFNGSRWPALAFWLAIFAVPFVVFFGQRAIADIREAQRAREVAAFTRQVFPKDHPRLLEINGYVTTQELIIFLDTLDIDEIAMFQSRAHRGVAKAQVFKLVAHCRGRGHQYLSALATKGRLAHASKADNACLDERRDEFDDDRRQIPAIMFLLGTATTLKLPGTSWSSGNYEARLRADGMDVLLDYWERPYLTRPATPSPWGYAYPANTDWKAYRAPGRATFFARATGLMPATPARP